MTRKNISEIKTGMILGEDVLRDGKDILLNAGSVISDHLIQMLVQQGIKEVAITDVPVESEIPKEEKKKEPEKTVTIPAITTYIAHDQMSAMVSIEP
jgi:hypothetical protein